MNSMFGEIFLFLTDLAWKSRITIPVLMTTAFLIMDVRLQIEINIQTGQVGAPELENDDGIEDNTDDFETDDDSGAAEIDDDYED